MDLAIALLLFYYVGKSKDERGEDLKNGWFGLALLFSVLGAVGVACQKLSRPPKIHNAQGQAVTVIGGADGPAAIVVAGHGRPSPWRAGWGHARLARSGWGRFPGPGDPSLLHISQPPRPY